MTTYATNPYADRACFDEERVRNDIDRLVYLADTLENLLAYLPEVPPDVSARDPRAIDRYDEKRDLEGMIRASVSSLRAALPLIEVEIQRRRSQAGTVACHRSRIRAVDEARGRYDDAQDAALSYAAAAVRLREDAEAAIRRAEHVLGLSGRFRDPGPKQGTTSDGLPPSRPELGAPGSSPEDHRVPPHRRPPRIAPRRSGPNGAKGLIAMGPLGPRPADGGGR